MRGTAYWSPLSLLVSQFRQTLPKIKRLDPPRSSRFSFLRLCAAVKRLGLGWSDLFLGHQFTKLAGFIHFHHDIAAAYKFAFDI